MLTTPNRFGLGRRLVEQGRDLGEAPRGLRRRQPSRVWWGSRPLHRSGTAGVGDHEERATGGGESKRESQTLFRACCAPAAAGCPDPDGSPGLVPDLFRVVPRNRLEDRSRPVPCSSCLVVPPVSSSGVSSRRWGRRGRGRRRCPVRPRRCRSVGRSGRSIRRSRRGWRGRSQSASCGPSRHSAADTA